MVIHHAFPSQKHYEYLEIKEKRRDLKMIYILAIKGRTATIIQRYFSNLNLNNKFNFRQKLRDTFWERRNVFSRNSVGWFIYAWCPIARRNVYRTLIKQSVARTEHSGVRTDTASGGFVNVCNRI